MNRLKNNNQGAMNEEYRRRSCERLFAAFANNALGHYYVTDIFIIANRFGIADGLFIAEARALAMFLN
jgi:hypothetical protein